jgi:RNA polymerase sigma factor (sigma-70 family)
VNKQQFRDADDRELLEKFYTDHNNEWLGILLPRYTLLLLGVCMKYLKNEEDSKDAVQQIFLKTISELHKYKVDYIRSWIYMIAKNYCLMSLRNKERKYVEINEHTALAADTVEPGAFIEKDNTLTEMNKALLLLNKEQQQCITLFYLEKESYTEIAEHTGLDMMQVKSHIQNGKRNLRLFLKKNVKQ